MTAFWIAAWTLAVLVCVLPPAVTLASVKRELRERERRRANIRKMSTRKLLAALENPLDHDDDTWRKMLAVAERRGLSHVPAVRSGMLHMAFRLWPSAQNKTARQKRSAKP